MSTPLATSPDTSEKRLTIFHLVLWLIAGVVLASVLSGPLHAQSYFFGRSDFAVGSDPVAIAMGDFNGDGIMDLVTSNFNDNTISVLLGKRDGTFAPQATYATGPTPLSVTVGDFNGDGNLDVAILNGNCNFFPTEEICSSSSVSVFLGKGDGTFLPPVTYAVGSAGDSGEGPVVAGIAAADFNRDGKLDLAVTNGADNNVGVLLGNGDGTFQGQVVYPTANVPQAIVVANFTGGSNLDIAIACGGVISVLKGNGDGTFQTHIDSGAGGAAMAAGDFNGDGILDLVVTQQIFGPTTILLGRGDGTFTAQATYPGGAGVAVADLNGDTKADLLLFGSGRGYSFTVQLGNGDGTFGSAVEYGDGGGSIAAVVADINGDGKLDVATANSVGNSVSVLLGFGDGTFVGLQDYPSGQYSIVSADFGGQHPPDLAALNNSTINVILNNGNGTFQPAIVTNLGQTTYQMVAGDFNGDGKTDIATTYLNCNLSGCLPGNAVVLLGNGNGTFQSPLLSTVGLRPLNLAAGDFNHDGKLDLAVSNSEANTVSILLGNGDGTFQPHVDYPTPPGTGALAVADLNGDGNPDLVVLDTSVIVFLGKGDGTFGTRTDYTLSGGTSLVIDDFNGDGIPDVAVTAGQVYVFLGKGDGTFQTPVSSSSGGSFLSAADFNGDGKLDLAIGGVSATDTALALGVGNGTFQNVANYLTAHYYLGSVIALDLNGDGVPDLASTDIDNSTMEVMLSAPFKAVSPSALNFGSQGTGTVSAPQTITLSNPSNVKFAILNIGSTGNFGQTNDCGSELTPGTNCTISVTFSPSGTGPQSGAVTLSDGTRSSPQSITLTGIGVNGPFLAATPGHVGFLPQTVGTMSAPVAILLQNTGNATLNITAIGVAGLDPSDFGQTNNCGSSLMPGGGCTVNVTFTPLSGGVRTANISITDNASGSPQMVPLIGTGLSQGYTLTVSTTGGGHVTSADGFIDCPYVCSHTYPAGTLVTLTASASTGWNFTAWGGNCTGFGSCVLDMTQDMMADATFTYPGAVLQFVPVTPCRLVDTRQTGGPITGGTFRSFYIPQLGGCNIPTTAGAYSLNVTLVPPPGRAVGFLTIWPTGQDRPNISTMNSWDGRYKANAVIVPAGIEGGVNVYVSNYANVVLDIDGYFEPVNGSTLAFYPLKPCRVADTRNPDSPLGGPYLVGNSPPRNFPVMDATACNIPSNAQAYALNFTTVPRNGPLWVFSAWPSGQPQPGTSTLNAPTGTVVANAAIVPAGLNGDIAAWASNDTDLVIDINGYFAPPGPGGLSLYSQEPCRALDTRYVGSGAPFTGLLSPPLDVVNSACEVSPTAQAFVLNATIVPQSVPVWFLTLWPDGASQPNVSTLNSYDGAVTSNMAIVPSNNGVIDAYTVGLTQLILDISSYFAP